MKKISVILGVCTFMLASGAIRLFAQVKYDSTPVTGTVTVTSFGFGKDKGKSLADADAAAINALLFVGLPGSQYETPMITDDSKKDNVVVKDLLNGGYTQFVTENIFLSEEKLTKKMDGVKGKSVQYKITINCEALRRYLEKNSVVRKFGI